MCSILNARIAFNWTNAQILKNLNLRPRALAEKFPGEDQRKKDRKIAKKPEK